MKKIIFFTVTKQTKIFNSTIVAFLIAAMIVGGCSKQKEPELDFPVFIMKKWQRNMDWEGRRYDIEFKTDGTYSYVTENENINGNYRIYESKKATYYYNITSVDGDSEEDAYLYKMLVSGSSVFDQMWVYIVHENTQIAIEIYSGNEIVQNIGMLWRIDY